MTSDLADVESLVHDELAEKLIKHYFSLTDVRLGQLNAATKLGGRNFAAGDADSKRQSRLQQPRCVLPPSSWVDIIIITIETADCRLDGVRPDAMERWRRTSQDNIYARDGQYFGRSAAVCDRKLLILQCDIGGSDFR